MCARLKLVPDGTYAAQIRFRSGPAPTPGRILLERMRAEVDDFEALHTSSIVALLFCGDGSDLGSPESYHLERGVLSTAASTRK